MTFRDFITSIFGIACLIILKFIIASICICSSIDLINFKKPSPFFTFKRIAGFFLLMLGLRIAVSSILPFIVT